jgi:DnaJ homolog subfamily C member 13
MLTSVVLTSRHRALLNTLRSSTPFVIENTALLLHVLSIHSPPAASAIRDSALSSAILLQQFFLAIFSPLEGQRFLSRYLCSLWLSGPMDCDEKRLLKRMVPHGFMAYLSMPLVSPAEEAQLDEIEHDSSEDNVREQRDDSALSDASSGTNTARLRSRISSLASASSKIAASRQYQENFRIFFHVLTRDHSLADLIWSQQTRRELRIALESELQAVNRALEARGVDSIAWNHQQFSVAYPSLENEVRVGNVYMRLWLQAGDSFIRSWDDPTRLFELLFRRFLCELDRNPKVRPTLLTRNESDTCLY